MGPIKKQVMKNDSSQFSIKKNDLRFNGEKLNEESVKKAIQFFADNCQGMIDEVKNGTVKVNDPEGYIKYCEKQKQKWLNGDFKISLTFLQHAYYIQTGESIALLP